MRASSGKERSIAGTGVQSECASAHIYPKDELKRGLNFSGEGVPGKCPRKMLKLKPALRDYDPSVLLKGDNLPLAQREANIITQGPTAQVEQGGHVSIYRCRHICDNL